MRCQPLGIEFLLIVVDQFLVYRLLEKFAFPSQECLFWSRFFSESLQEVIPHLSH